MPRDPNIADAFDVYTIVLLRRPADAPEMPEEELDALQARHLAYRAQVRRDGVLAAGTLAFPGATGSVGEHRSMPDD